jgi:hypothetical protein
MIEFGHAQVIMKGKQKVVIGQYAPNPFMSNAMKEKSGESVEIMKAELRKRIDKFFAKSRGNVKARRRSTV